MNSLNTYFSLCSEDTKHVYLENNLPDGVAVLFQYLSHCHLNVPVLCTEGWNVRLTLDSALFLESGYHYYGSCLLLHHHVPKVSSRVCQRPLGGNVRLFFAIISLEPKHKSMTRVSIDSSERSESSNIIHATSKKKDQSMPGIHTNNVLPTASSFWH